MPVTEMQCAPPGWRASRIRLGLSVAANPDPALHAFAGARPVHFVLDSGAARHWSHLACGTDPIRVDGGESCKDIRSLEGLLRELARRGVTREHCLVVVGGGAVCDLGGLAAALCLRGIDHVLVPTTLLAMVDASVGGKTAIDLPEGKNLVGAFHQPVEVLIDPEFVHTESDDRYRAGLAEIAKVAIGLDADLFERCERDASALRVRDRNRLRAAIEAAVAAKIRIVESDPGEAGSRRLLNLGHTLGHALEAHSGFVTPHGLAVAQGLHHVLALAVKRGLLSPEHARRAGGLLAALGLPREALPSPGALLPFVARDKKVRGDQVAAVLPIDLGRARIVAMTPHEFLAV